MKVIVLRRVGIPIDFVRLSLLDSNDSISQLACQLVLFLVDGIFHFVLQLFDPKLSLRSPRLVRWAFAGMGDITVDIDEKRFEILVEGDVIVGATESAPFAKFSECQAAHGTLFFIDSREFLGHFVEFELFAEHFVEGCRRVGGTFLAEELAGMLFAKMHNGRTFWAGQFRDMEGGGFFAVLALHD